MSDPCAYNSHTKGIYERSKTKMTFKAVSMNVNINTFADCCARLYAKISSKVPNVCTRIIFYTISYHIQYKYVSINPLTHLRVLRCTKYHWHKNIRTACSVSKIVTGIKDGRECLLMKLSADKYCICIFLYIFKDDVHLVLHIGSAHNKAVSSNIKII